MRLSGLDVVAADALRIPGNYYDAPPVICYVDRGQGAAIRRAKTRLPGGRDNPVAVIRIPSANAWWVPALGSSLIHEVGSSGSRAAGPDQLAPPGIETETAPALVTPGRMEFCGSRWISEIAADFWSVAKLGISSTIGLDGGCESCRGHSSSGSLGRPASVPVDTGKAELRDRTALTLTRSGSVSPRCGRRSIRGRVSSETSSGLSQRWNKRWRNSSSFLRGTVPLG